MMQTKKENTHVKHAQTLLRGEVKHAFKIALYMGIKFTTVTLHLYSIDMVHILYDQVRFIFFLSIYITRCSCLVINCKYASGPIQFN